MSQDAARLGNAYTLVLANMALFVRRNGVAQAADQVRARGDLSANDPPFGKLGEAPPRSRALLSQAKLVGAVRRYFAERAETKQAATGLFAVAAAQPALTGEEAPSISGALTSVCLLNDGMAALKGTELEGLIPERYVAQLRERWLPPLSAAASRVAARLTGDGFHGFMFEREKNFATVLQEMAASVGGVGDAETRLRQSLQRAHARLSAGLKGDGSIDASALEGARQQAAGVLEDRTQAQLLSGMHRSMLSALCRAVRRVSDFAHAYPGERLPPPDLAAARSGLMWNTVMGMGGLSLGDLMM